MYGNAEANDDLPLRLWISGQSIPVIT